MQPLSLTQRIDQISQHIVRARLYLDLWSYFEEEDSRHRIIHTMREYNEFFRFTPHAYLATFVIYASGAFDKRRDTISLRPLFREVSVAGHLQQQNISLIETSLEQAQPIADKVAILRHKAFAHRSAHISYNDVFQMASVTPNELRELTVIALSISNCLLLAVGLHEQHFRELPRNAAESMMDALARK
ncbi:MAG: hypothetical protein JJ969_06855 [Rhizobiaceae bacterium]|nr:hypothetical protein [Rhizobiaceae bacterium]